MADIVSPEKRSQNMSAIRSKNTKPEVYLRKLLFAQGYRYRIADKSVPGHPDIFLRKYNTAIFVNGCFWHRHPGCKYAYTPKSRVEFWQKKFDDNVRRDSAVKAELLEHGIKCLIVWELFCNKIAGLALVPTVQLKRNKNFFLMQQYGIDDTYVSALARDFAVSREVILHRLWDIDFIGKSDYFDILNRYTDEYRAYKQKKKTDGFLPPALDKGTQVGKLYTKAVMSAYHAEKLTPREASNYLLGLRVKHFEAVERWCY